MNEQDVVMRYCKAMLPSIEGYIMKRAKHFTTCGAIDMRNADWLRASRAIMTAALGDAFDWIRPRDDAGKETVRRLNKF